MAIARNGFGVKDILIACVDGLTGFPNAIQTVFPKTTSEELELNKYRGALGFNP